MKKIIPVYFTIIFLLLGFVLSSCGLSDGRDEGKNRDSLTVFYFPSVQNSAKVKIVESIFKDFGINIDYYSVDNSDEFLEYVSPEFVQKLSADIMAGKGPDIFLFDFNGSFADLNKKMDAGVFYDINDFINADNSFNLNDYERRIMDAGIYKGKRYILPVSYHVPMLISTKEKFDKYGYKIDDFTRFNSFLSGWEAFLNERDSLFVDPYLLWMSLSTTHYGFLDECVDYEKNEVNLKTPTLKRVMDILRNDYLNSEFYPNSVSYIGSKDSLFNFSETISNSLDMIKDYGWDNAVIIPVPNAFGNSTASIMDYCMISKNCKNPDLAWTYVKILLSCKIQNTSVLSNEAFYNGIGVMKGSMDQIIEDWFDKYSIEIGKNKEAKDMISGVYNSYDNVVLPFFKGYSVVIQMVDYIENSSMNDFDKLKAETENYFNIWLSE